MKVYDPRLDTVPGAHPWDDRYHVESDNPALTLIGMRAPHEWQDFDWDAVVAAANLCDAPLPAPKTCGTCRFFGKVAHSEDEPLSRGQDEAMQPGRYHFCELIKHRNGYREIPSQTGAAPTDGAIVIDGSGYFAALCVSEEFGCNQWKTRLVEGVQDSQISHVGNSGTLSGAES